METFSALAPMMKFISETLGIGWDEAAMPTGKGWS
jgi:hypothetical protein